MANKLSLLLLVSFACTATVTPPASNVRLGFSAKNFDRSARPCDDFYQYADGGWIASHPIPADETGWYISSDAVAGNEQTLREILEQAGALSTPADIRT